MNKTSDQLNELFAALAKAQGQLKSVNLDGDNPYYKSKYATLDACWETCRVPLSANGLTIIQTIEEHEGKWFLNTFLGHASGQYISSRMPLLMAKYEPQAMGSACSYMRRYSLNAMVGLTQGEIDDDGERAMKGYREEEAKPRSKKTPNTDIFGLAGKVAPELGMTVDVEELERFVNNVAQLNKKTPQQIIAEALVEGQIKYFAQAFLAWKP